MVPDGVDVPHRQFVAFKQLGFLHRPFEQTMLFVQSALLLQLSPQERGGAGVAVAVGVGVPAHKQSSSVVQLGFLQTPSVEHVIPLPQSALVSQVSPQDGGMVGDGLGLVLGLGETLGVTLGEATVERLKLIIQAFPFSHEFLLTFHLQSAA